MGDLVAHMSPKTRALVRRTTGGIRLHIPVDFGKGETHKIEIGLQIMGAPLDVFDSNPAAVFHMREAIQKALTGDIEVKYGVNGRTIETAKFGDLITDVIVEKVRDTL